MKTAGPRSLAAHGMVALRTGRGQCLFCSFRPLITAPPRRSPAAGREYSASSVRSKRAVPPSSKSSTSSKSSSRHPSSSRSKGSSRSLLRALLDPEKIQENVRSSLVILKKLLETTQATAESDVTQLQALDPTGKYWPEFQEEVQQIFDAASEARKAPFAGLIHDIGLANQAAWKTELPRILHFGFIDYILMKRAEDSPGDGSAVDLKFPTEWYTKARQVQRDVHLHIGPTNSGKTYTALKRLEESANGFYAGPLRLLAHEVYSRFKAKGVSCDLVTGDDVRHDEDPHTKLSASTVEMVDTGRTCDVAVIDEIQMMADQERGWAWTRAFLGANAKEVHLCGETRVLPLIRELTASTGDLLHVHEYKRLNPLKVMTKTLKGDLKNLRKGDCIVAFSVMHIHALKQQIELDTGRRCAIVYGSLPPETRARQAALFNDPESDYDFLVASDAIGMGLNLSVKRIIFHSVVKWNGHAQVALSTPQIKQIGGRAGRYRTSHQASKNDPASTAQNVGLVTTLNDADLPVIRAAMQTEAEPIQKAGILPPGETMQEFESRLPKGVPFEYILRRLCGQAALTGRFRVCSIREQIYISRIIESVKGLTLEDRLILSAAPAGDKTQTMESVVRVLAECVAHRRQVTIVDIPEIDLEILGQPITGDRSYLVKLEDLHKALVLYLWLSYRFVSTFKDREMAMYAKGLAESRINTCLVEFSANPELRKRVMSVQARPRLPEILAQAVSTTEMETEFDVPDTDTVLPLDWTARGSESTTLDEAESINQSNSAAQ
jgi:ATP-dependent RNA helicase SUPV3L1/SUV3